MAADEPFPSARGAARRSLSLKGRALALLAQREHSEAELRRKLLRHAHAASASASASEAGGSKDSGDFDPEAVGAGESGVDDASSRIDEVIEWLRAHRYLDDQRFVESRVHIRAARYGNLRIRQELEQHVLTLPEGAAQALKANELDRAREVWRRKFGVAPVGPGEHARQARFLAQRGFSADVVSKLLRPSRRAAQEEPDMPPEG